MARPFIFCACLLALWCETSIDCYRRRDSENANATLDEQRFLQPVHATSSISSKEDPRSPVEAESSDTLKRRPGVSESAELTSTVITPPPSPPEHASVVITAHTPAPAPPASVDINVVSPPSPPGSVNLSMETKDHGSANVSGDRDDSEETSGDGGSCRPESCAMYSAVSGASSSNFCCAHGARTSEAVSHRYWIPNIVPRDTCESEREVPIFKVHLGDGKSRNVTIKLESAVHGNCIEFRMCHRPFISSQSDDQDDADVVAAVVAVDDDCLDEQQIDEECRVAPLGRVECVLARYDRSCEKACLRNQRGAGWADSVDPDAFYKTGIELPCWPPMPSWIKSQIHPTYFSNEGMCAAIPKRRASPTYMKAIVFEAELQGFAEQPEGTKEIFLSMIERRLEEAPNKYYVLEGSSERHAALLHVFKKPLQNGVKANYIETHNIVDITEVELLDTPGLDRSCVFMVTNRKDRRETLFCSKDEGVAKKLLGEVKKLQMQERQKCLESETA